MTPEELNRKYAAASWLIARRSASAAGKALLFSSESLDAVMREIATIYGLGDEDVALLRPIGDDGMVANVQKMAQSLLGSGTDALQAQAFKLARTAIRNGQTGRMLATLVKAGPKAAGAVAAGGKVASRGVPWGWIATAGYAAGSAGWFAYNARAFNVKAFELVRQREGIETIGAPARAADETSTSPTFPSIRSRAGASAN